MRAALPLWSLACALALPACEDPIVTSTAGRTGGPAAKPSAAPSGVPSALPRAPIDESAFVESELSRDPFRSYARAFMAESKNTRPSQLKVVLPEFTLDELKLIGIVTRLQPAKAMLVDPNGKGHVVQRGEFVGRADLVQTTGRAGSTYEVNWRVDRIRDGDVVFVREDPQNPDVPTITRVIPLRPEGSLVQK